MEKESFGVTSKGENASLYTLENANHMQVKVTDYGAALVSVFFADKEGKIRDIILGYDDAKGYEEHTCFFGATIGRNGNRIANGRFLVNGKEYQIDQNENENNLHSGKKGFDTLLWEVKEYTESSISLYHYSPEEEQGFPGNLDITVTFRLDEENTLHITYDAKADADTVMNFTNHTYFNLAGHESGSICQHTLQLMAEKYNPVIDSKSIPTGENAAVKGTPMDFTKPKKIGKDIEADFEQLKFTKGYDHNYVLSEKPGERKLAARAVCEESGIAMEAFTDCCAMQFYAGNFIGEQTGKKGAAYHDRQGFCLESQFCPNAVNDPNFVSPIVPANTDYHSETSYHFYHI